MIGFLVSDGFRISGEVLDAIPSDSDADLESVTSLSETWAKCCWQTAQRNRMIFAKTVSSSLIQNAQPNLHNQKLTSQLVTEELVNINDRDVKS